MSLLAGKDIPPGFVSLSFLGFVGVILLMDFVSFHSYSLAYSEKITGLADRSNAGY